MNWVVYLFGGGLAFFLGAGLIVAAVGAASLPQSTATAMAVTLLAALGLLLVAASAAPLPLSLYVVAFVATGWWVMTERLDRFEPERGWARRAAMFVWLALIALEAPYHFTPSLPTGPHERLMIFGDSVTAGMGDERAPRWPELFAVRHRIDVRDYSKQGATARSMAEIAARTPLADGVVLLEIGGNDLLGGRSSADFERELDALLATVSGPGRAVVMFELPLPPLSNGFGAAQRTLAAKHGVLLLPKRLFAEILAAEGLTADGIHLSAQGHERMAKKVAVVLGL